MYVCTRIFTCMYVCMHMSTALTLDSSFTKRATRQAAPERAWARVMALRCDRICTNVYRSMIIYVYIRMCIHDIHLNKYMYIYICICIYMCTYI